MAAFLVGLLWGLSEGSWFFIIPDIALSYFALSGPKKAIIATLTTVLGAMLAATLLYAIFALYPETQIKIVELWQNLPGFYPKMMDTAATHLTEAKAQGLLSGPSSGIPYRFYVLESFKQGISLIDLLLWTPLARLERIAIAPIAILVLRFLIQKITSRWFPNLNQKNLKIGVMIFISIYWIGIYVWYWGFFLPTNYK